MDKIDPKKQAGFFLYPWEKGLDRLVTPLQEFVRRETTSGIVLMIVALITVILANSPLRGLYAQVVNMEAVLGIGSFLFEKPLLFWVNEGLMTFFFFVVGLEIKREVLVGELSDRKKAVLPVVAAAGGMIAPALIYHAIIPDGDFARGWGIPMATDIAFCISILVLLRRRIPQSLMVILVTLAIADDLGAVLVIAVFYTQQFSGAAFGFALALALVLILFNLTGVRWGLPYLLAGIALWAAFLKTGVHPTVAGVLVAFCIPARARYHPNLFTSRARDMMALLDRLHRPKKTILDNVEQYSVLRRLDHDVHLSATPLQRLRDIFHYPVALVIIPLFGFFNSGIALDPGLFSPGSIHPVSLAVLLGLALGKPIGIFLSGFLAVRLKVAMLPEGMRFGHLAGLGILGGIGFTMSLFISELSFPGSPDLLAAAKRGVFLASLLSGVVGYLWLRVASALKP